MDATRPKVSKTTPTAKTNTSFFTNPHYQIHYWNKMWRDWLVYDQIFYLSEQSAQKQLQEYKKDNPSLSAQIFPTTALIDKPKRYRKKKNTKITSEPVTRQPH